MGAGLADPDGVRGREIVLPKADSPLLPLDTLVMVEPTDKREGRDSPPLVGVDVLPISRRCGMRVGVASSTRIKTKLVATLHYNI